MAVALIVAAGSGERLGAGKPKALVELAGRALLAWSVDALAATPAVQQIVVALFMPMVRVTMTRIYAQEIANLDALVQTWTMTPAPEGV